MNFEFLIIFLIYILGDINESAIGLFWLDLQSIFT